MFYTALGALQKNDSGLWQMREQRFPVNYRKGVYLAELNLWLDPGSRKSRAFVSHAHSDHALEHREVIATPQTLDLMRVRNLRPGNVQGLRFGEFMELKSGRIKLLPAGHVLGSAQIFAETDSGTFLYTGDFKTRRGLSCEPLELAQADVLVIETTFGRPEYRFPAAESVHSRILEFCHEALSDGVVPVLMGYSLGKAQEILAILGTGNFSIAVHESIAKVCEIYRFHGIDLPRYGRLRGQDLSGCVAVIPPNSDRNKLLGHIPEIRTAVVTGWGLDASARFRYRCDEAFPLSDHADYDELLDYVEQVNPKVVYTLHGSAAGFASDLRARGIEAWSMVSENQLEFGFG